jgi:hypothetical protein
MFAARSARRGGDGGGWMAESLEGASRSMSMIEIKTNGFGPFDDTCFIDAFPYDLYTVYQVLSRSEWNWRGIEYANAFEMALDKMMRRIERDGCGAARFATMQDVYAYAKQVRKCVLLDARRHREVTRRYEASVGAGGPGYASRSEEWLERDRRETDEWLAEHLGVDDARLYSAVYIDGYTVAQLARMWGIKEGTLRWRLDRAERSANDLLKGFDRSGEAA